MPSSDPVNPAVPPPPGAEARRPRRVPASKDGHDPVQELKAAVSNLGEVATYLQQLVGAKVAQTLYGFRKLALLAMLGAVVGIAGMSIIVTSAALLVLGLADLIAAFMPDRFDWLGKLLVGLGGVGLAMLAVYIVLRRAAAVGKRMAVEQYRTALHEQRKRYGHDAFSRSAAHAAEQDLAARRAPARTEEEIAALREKRVQAEKAQRQMEEDFARIKGK